VKALIKGIHAEFIPAQWDGKETHGIKVIGKAVLVLMDECSEKTSGHVILPADQVEALSAGAESGVLIAVPPGAFLLNEDMTPWAGDRPEPGDRVYIAKYSGQQVRGKDGRMYRLMDYGCIGAVYDHIDISKPIDYSKPVAESKQSPSAKKGLSNGISEQPRAG
jgi:co-chaperonin GroES (HSP10)